MLTTLEGHLITPTVLGRRLTLDPLAVFLAIAFWSWLWGPMGAFLAVPLLIVALVIVESRVPVERRQAARMTRNLSLRAPLGCRRNCLNQLSQENDRVPAEFISVLARAGFPLKMLQCERADDEWLASTSRADVQVQDRARRGRPRLGADRHLGRHRTVVFLIVAGFVALAERYGPLIAALALGGLFLLITIVAVVCCLSSQRQTAAAAQLALAARSQAPWLDPRYLGVGIQIGRAIGWRRLIPLAAVGVLAAGLAKEWIGRSRPAGD